MVPNTPNFVTHLECSLDGDHYAANEPHNLSRANKPLLVRYDLSALAAAVDQLKVVDQEFYDLAKVFFG